MAVGCTLKLNSWTLLSPQFLFSIYNDILYSIADRKRGFETVAERKAVRLNIFGRAMRAERWGLGVVIKELLEKTSNFIVF